MRKNSVHHLKNLLFSCLGTILTIVRLFLLLTNKSGDSLPLSARLKSGDSLPSSARLKRMTEESYMLSFVVYGELK